jgi:hypothetical protein
VSRVRVPLLVLAWLVPLGVLAQAVLAGQALFSDPQLFGLHGGVGHGVLLLALLTAVLAWVGRVGRGTALVASLSVLLLIGQTGLGYAGRRSGLAIASSLHVPLGTVVLATTTVVAVVLTQQLRTGTR